MYQLDIVFYQKPLLKSMTSTSSGRTVNYNQKKKKPHTHHKVKPIHSPCYSEFKIYTKS